MELAKVKVTANRLTVEKRHIIVAGTIGATVVFEFDDLWSSMDTKTLVWRSGTVTKDDITASGIVPAEVMEKPGRELFVGVYGTKGDTATPTLWADLGYIHDGADPSGDESTDPSLPVWAQLQTRVDDLEGEGLAEAVAAYLEENPVEAGATAEEAAQIKKNSEDIVKLNADKLDASKLPEAVNDALAQAKASGEFDGADGQPGIVWDLIADVTTEEFVNQFEFYKEENGEKVLYDAFYFGIKAPAGENSAYYDKLYINASNYLGNVFFTQFTSVINATETKSNYAYVEYVGDKWVLVKNPAELIEETRKVGPAHTLYYRSITNGQFPIGTRAVVYGRRYNG